MKKIVTTLTSGLLLGTGLVGLNAPAVAADVSANVTLASHYIFRGRDRSEGAPAIQGGFDYAFEKGLYLGIWGSSAKTADPVTGENESIETNYYLGFSHAFTNYGVSIDVGVVQYDYPFASSDSNEIYAVGSYLFDKYGEISASLWMELDTATTTVNGVELPTTGNAGTFLYYNLGYELPLPNKFALGASLGYQTYDGDPDPVTDYALGIKRPLGGVDIALSYSDSDAGVKKSDFITLSVSKKI